MSTCSALSSHNILGKTRLYSVYILHNFTGGHNNDSNLHVQKLTTESGYIILPGRQAKQRRLCKPLEASKGLRLHRPGA